MTEQTDVLLARESTLERLWGQLAPLVLPVVLLLIALYFVFDVRSNWLNSQRAAALTACQSNLKNIGTAMEMYSEDNSGRYPESLTSLTPKYLETVPECPFQDQGYKLSTGPQAPGNTSAFQEFYVVWCGGEAHGDTRVPTDYPRYDAISGLRQSY